MGPRPVQGTNRPSQLCATWMLRVCYQETTKCTARKLSMEPRQGQRCGTGCIPRQSQPCHDSHSRTGRGLTLVRHVVQHEHGASKVELAVVAVVRLGHWRPPIGGRSGGGKHVLPLGLGSTRLAAKLSRSGQFKCDVMKRASCVH